MTKIGGALALAAERCSRIQAIAAIVGLLVATPALGATAATPKFSPVAGTYSQPQTVAITDTTAGARIYYTTNGSTPTTSSTLYSAPITIAATTTIKALAVATGYTNSAVASATFTMVAATPAFSPAAGTYSQAQAVALTDATPGSRIYYTTNGTTPTTSSTLYSAPIPVTATTTIKALAVANGYTNSAVASAVFTLVAGAPTFSPVAGTYTAAQSVTIASSTPGARIYYTTNGTTPTTGSTLYSQAIPIGSTTTIKALAAATGFANSAASSATFTLNLKVATPTFSPPAGTYAGSRSVTILDSTPGAKVYYTTNGTTPTTSSVLYSAPVQITSSKTLKALAVATGYANSAVGSAAYTITPPIAEAPALSPLPGSYPGTQVVTLATATPDAAIYYSLDGSTPTVDSTPYTGPIAVNATTTVRAMAVASGFVTSPVTTGTYAIPAVPALLGADLVISARGNGITTTAPFSTGTPGALLLAFVSAAGPAGTAQTTGVTGGELGWTLVRRANSQAGTAEIWSASAWAVLRDVTVQSVPALPGYDQQITVLVLSGARVAPGASASSAGTSGAPAVSLTATAPGSWFLAVGVDTATSSGRTVGTNQTLLSEFNDAPANATFWVQQAGSLGPVAGSSVLLNDSAPSTGRWNFAAVEICQGEPEQPTLVPAPGLYPGALHVTAATRNPRSRIYYTTDGSAPTTSSRLFTGPIPVTDSTTIRAISIGDASSSQEVTGLYRTSKPTAPGGLTTDFVVSARGYGTVETQPFDATGTTQLLVFVATDGPAGVSQHAAVSVPGYSGIGYSGAQLVATAPVPAGQIAIFSVQNISGAKGITIRSVQTQPGYQQLVTVVGLSGCDMAVYPIAGVNSGVGGAAATYAAEVTTSEPAWVFAVGGAKTAASSPRQLPAGHTLVDEYLDTAAGIDFWVEQLDAYPGTSYGSYQTSSIGAAGSGLDSSWGLAAIAVIPAPAPAPTILPGAGSYPGTFYTTVTGAVPWGDIYYWTNYNGYSGGPCALFQPDMLHRVGPTPYSGPFRFTAPLSCLLAAQTPPGYSERAYQAAVWYGGSGPLPVDIPNESTVSVQGPGSLVSPPFSTRSFGTKLVLAFISSEGPASGAQEITVSGAGLDWTLLKRANAQPGSAEVWGAYADLPLTMATVQAVQSVPGYLQQMTVVVLDGGMVGQPYGGLAP